MERLARLVIRRRRYVIGAWIALTLLGAYSAGAVSDRWLEEFSIPGYSAYETNQRTLKIFGTGAQPPHVAVFTAKGDVREMPAIGRAIGRVAAKFPDFRVGSYYSTKNDAYVSRDRHTTFATFYPPGQQGFDSNAKGKEVRAAFKQAAPPGVIVHVTGRDLLYESEGGDSNGPSVLTEALIGGVGALIILLFVFGTLPAVAMPIMIAISSILNTFTLVWLLTYVTSVSLIVQFLVALVGLGVAIDYALLMIFRFREELAQGEDRETAIVETMKHAGRSVIVSGSTVAIGLVSMVILPVPVIRSIGLGGLLIPLVCVLSSITLLPAMLYVLGHRINSLRVMPKRLVAAPDPESGFWARWARLVIRRPLLMGGIGAAIVVLLLIPGVQLNPAEAQVKDLAGAKTEDAVQGLDALTRAGISHGVTKPFVVLVVGTINGGSPVKAVARYVAQAPGVAGAAAPPEWRKSGLPGINKAALLEAFPSEDAATRHARRTIDNLRDDVIPSINNGLTMGPGVDVAQWASLGGTAPEDRDFVRAVYGKFPYVLLFVVLLTFVLLMRAFRSVILPLKAVILNLVSLGAAFGIIVFIFQMGHGSEAIWNVPSTDAIISWIPLMIFAFLYGLSMDYEVFMLTRMREAYDETGDTKRAIELGLARTGKLVTSAALVLMFAFFVLSTSPGVDVKQFGIGLAAGIIFDATVIRALLVPSIMRLLGDANWWFPKPLERILLVRRGPAAADTAS